MSNLTLFLDGFTVMFFTLIFINDGMFKFVNGILFLSLIAIRLIIRFDWIKGKTLSIDELKVQYPEIYYKFYASKKEKDEYADREVLNLIKKSFKSDFRMWVEDQNDLVDTMLTVFFIIMWIVLSIVMFMELNIF